MFTRNNVKNSPHIFIHCWPSSIPSCFHYSQEISYLCVVNHGCGTPRESNCALQVPVLPQTTVCLSRYLSVCLCVCVSCRTAQLYDPTHFPLTFHFLDSHPVSRTTALCESIGCAVSVSRWLALCRGCARNCQFCYVYYPSRALILLCFLWFVVMFAHVTL